VVALAWLALGAWAQAPKALPLPEFDVASVRQNKTSEPKHSNVPLDTGNVYSAIDPSDGRTAAGGYFVATNQPLWQYIVFAYKLSGTQELALRFSYFAGLETKTPDWVAGGLNASPERFNIEARAPEDTSIDQIRLMMQALLAERFHLVVHHEMREAPVFGLALVKAGATGPNLQAHPAADVCAAGAVAEDKPAASTHSAVGELPPLCGVIAHVPATVNPRSTFGGRGVPLSLLANSLPTMTGMAVMPRPVIDQTGLAGLYDFNVSWGLSTDAESGDMAASFRGALKSQLGLELKPARAPVDILVVDHVEHPSEN